MSDATALVVVERMRQGLQRFGVGGTAKKLGDLAWRSLSRSLYLRERHVWYALDLEEPRVHPDLPPGYEWRRGSRADLAFLQELPTIGRHEAAQRYEVSGADLWLAFDRCGHPAFVCWTFRERAPVCAARGGWIDLPPGVACLEDSVTASAHRGRGLAAAVWSLIVDRLASEGAVQVITKVSEDNTPSRRAVEKAGFSPVALMSLKRVVRHARVRVQPYRATPVFTYLDNTLSR